MCRNSQKQLAKSSSVASLCLISIVFVDRFLVNRPLSNIGLRSFKTLNALKDIAVVWSSPPFALDVVAVPLTCDWTFCASLIGLVALSAEPLCAVGLVLEAGRVGRSGALVSRGKNRMLALGFGATKCCVVRLFRCAVLVACFLFRAFVSSCIGRLRSVRSERFLGRFL